jgi:hypothetical protein
MKKVIKKLKGGYPELNRELTVPHTVVLPIELYLPFNPSNYKVIEIIIRQI